MDRTRLEVSVENGAGAFGFKGILAVAWSHPAQEGPRGMNGFKVTQPIEVEALFHDVLCCLLNSLGLCATRAQRVPPAVDDSADE